MACRLTSADAVIRVLTAESSQGRFEGELSRFAVPAGDLLAPE